MIDPSGGGAGKAAGELLKEMQQAQDELQKTEQSSPGNTNNFSDTLQAKQPQASSAPQPVGEVGTPSNVLQNAKINAAAPSTRVGATARTERSKVADMIEGLVNGQDKMTQIMEAALSSNKKMSPRELLAMQAGVYRFSQELDLTSKVVEKATSGLKQTMNTQV